MDDGHGPRPGTGATCRTPVTHPRALVTGESQIDTVFGVQLAYDRCGAGPALVLLHGAGHRRQGWLPVQRRLAEHRGER